MARRYYFDHNACTPVDPRVLARFSEVESACHGNPGSLHGAGRRARGVVEAARCAVADTLGVDVDHVFFVSGGTEANNLAILGTGDLDLPVLAAAVEHPSVLAAAGQRGLVEWLVNADATAQIATPTEPVGLLTLTHGQNEVGSLQPIAEASELAGTSGVPLHVDASQTLGRCELDEVLRDADSITLSTHKAGGLRGCAVLIDKNPSTRPILFGGTQQLARRPGTESTSLIAATAMAVELAVAERQQRAEQMRLARDAFLESLDLDSIRVLTPAHSLPNTAMLMFDGVDSRELLPALDMAGVEASQGSACSSGSPTPPPVLLAMGLSEEDARSCVRFSFSQHASTEDTADGARIVKTVIQGLRARR